MTFALLVALEGFEPSQTEPESVVLPLHHKALLICECKGTAFLRPDQMFSQLFSKKIFIDLTC